MTLLSRLQDAPVGTRELDAHVEVAVRAIQAERTGLAREHWAKWTVSRDFWVEDAHTSYKPEPVTTSIDAALALAERVLPGKGWEALYSGLMNWRAHTPTGLQRLPLLVCAAIIAAKEGT